MRKILRGEKICKSFNDDNENKLVLKNVDLEINEGEFVTIMGPSGSGKSTLLYSVSGMDTIDSGNVYLNDKLISNCTEEEAADIRRNEIGFIFQQGNLLKNLSVIDNIVLTAMLNDRKAKDEINERARKIMEKTGILKLADRNISKISGGQMQRVGICRALINNPSIIFGDEPTGALNSKSTKEILDILNSLNEKGTTIMLVTHDAKVAAQSERILFMVDGEIVSQLQMNKYDKNKDNLLRRVDKITEKMRELSI